MAWNKAAIVLLCVAACSGADEGRSQEPAFYSHSMGVRYEEGPGNFHYVFNCALPIGNARESASGFPAQGRGAAAVCWPALMGRVQTTNGTLTYDKPVSGVLMVSASLVRFVPDDLAGPSMLPDKAPAEIQYSHNAKEITATLSVKEGAFAFAFRSLCLGCTSGAVRYDTKKMAQLNAEFREFEDSLTHFDVVSSHIHDLASTLRVGVMPKNQPSVTDPPEAMGLYGDLNGRFAALCPEPAKSCVQAYAKYQMCKRGSLQAECGDEPACSAYCAIPSDNLRSLKATFCTAQGGDSMALVPDWTPVAEKMDADRRARGPIDLKTVHLSPARPGPPLDFMGKPIDASNVCSVEGSYATAMMMHMSAAAAGSGMGSMGTAPLLNGSAPGGTASGAAVNGGPVSLPGAVMAGSRVSGASPVYPPVARAARISGAVVLQATISKTGEIKSLSVVSGPALLQGAAMEAVRTWTYRPYLVAGKAIEVETKILVNFNLSRRFYPGCAESTASGAAGWSGASSGAAVKPCL